MEIYSYFALSWLNLKWPNLLKVIWSLNASKHSCFSYPWLLHSSHFSSQDFISSNLYLYSIWSQYRTIDFRNHERAKKIDSLLVVKIFHLRLHVYYVYASNDFYFLHCLGNAYLIHYGCQIVKHTKIKYSQLHNS